MMKAFFIAIWHWIKSIFASCFGSRDNPAREEEPLPAASPEQQHEIYAPQPAERRQSSSVIHAVMREPVKLSEEESLLVLYYAHKGSNLYIDRLPEEKKNLAYDLIRKVVQLNMDNIDRSIVALKRLNPDANRLENSWRRVRADFNEGDSSEFNITLACKKMQETAPQAQATILNHIIHCFNICKIMLKLSLCKHQAVKKLIPPVLSKEQNKIAARMSESRQNNNTLEIVDKFNQPYEQPEPRRKRYNR